MKPANRILITILAVLMLAMITGCGAGNTATNSPAPTTAVAQGTPAASPTDTPEPTVTQTPYEQRQKVNVGTIKGPTGIGMVELMRRSDDKQTDNQYTFALAGSPDEMVAKITSGEVDIAAVPINLASTLFNKTQGKVQMVAINTLGVLYVLENGDQIQSVEDLRGKTIYATGQGATPEYILRDILTQNGMNPDEDVTIEFKAEHAELATLMTAGQINLGMLPEPNVTSVLMKSGDFRVALDLTAEFNKVHDTKLVQGCLLVRTEFAQQNPEALQAFLTEYNRSVDYVNANVQEAAQLVEKYEIMPSAAAAAQAIPKCNIVYIDGAEMMEQSEAMLKILFEANPSAVGGALPGEALYYIP